MSFFPTGSFNPLPDHFPLLYLIDTRWPDQAEADGFVLEEYSLTDDRLNTDLHGAKTLAVLKDIVPQLPPTLVTLVSTDRKIELKQFQSPGNIAEAIEAIRFYAPTRGSVVMINVSVSGQSVLADEHIAKQLTRLGRDGCVVIVSAGNTINLLNTSSVGIIVAAGYTLSEEGTADTFPNSAFGPNITCYLPGKIQTSVGEFLRSSAAAAQLTGVVLVMQNYARSKGRFLRAGELKKMFRTTGKLLHIKTPEGPTLPGRSPNWISLSTAIDRVFARISKQ